MVARRLADLQADGAQRARRRGWREFKHQGTGLLTSNIAEAGGFLKTHPRLDRPDIQLHIALVDNHGRTLHLARGYCVHVCVLRPKSRGTVRLTGADVRSAPLIDPQFLFDPEDLERVRSWCDTFCVLAP